MTYGKLGSEPSLYARGRPVFHDNDTITYWTGIGHVLGAHPLNVPAKIRGAWPKKDRERWLGVMKKLGYDCIAGSWIKVRK